YIGSMPGRIIQELRRCGTRNPVFMLDEIDKIGADFRGDPASALLEVLDPRQNNAFVDRYLDVPFDLSQVILIGTANYIEGIPELVREMLGPAKYVRETRLKTSKPGVVTGLAYTPQGGEVLHIEATRYRGKGNVTLTGQIGNVMKESVQAALSLLRSRDGELG